MTSGQRGLRMDESRLRELIREVVTEQFGPQPGAFSKNVDFGSGVISVRSRSVKLGRFDTGNDQDRVYLKDVFTLEESPRLGCGIMEMKESCFDWFLNYDEIDYVIEGRLEIIVGEKKVVGEAGSIIFIPRQTAIQFNAPGFV